MLCCAVLCFALLCCALWVRCYIFGRLRYIFGRLRYIRGISASLLHTFMFRGLFLPASAGVGSGRLLRTVLASPSRYLGPRSAVSCPASGNIPVRACRRIMQSLCGEGLYLVFLYYLCRGINLYITRTTTITD